MAVSTTLSPPDKVHPINLNFYSPARETFFIFRQLSPLIYEKEKKKEKKRRERKRDSSAKGAMKRIELRRGASFERARPNFFFNLNFILSKFDRCIYIHTHTQAHQKRNFFYPPRHFNERLLPSVIKIIKSELSFPLFSSTREIGPVKEIA